MIPDIARLRPGVVTRSISPENPTGAPGRRRPGHRGHRRRAPPATSGQGWKVSPSIEIAPRRTTSTWPTSTGPAGSPTSGSPPTPTTGAACVLRAYWDGADDAGRRGAARRLLLQRLGPVRPGQLAAVAVNPHGGFNCYWQMPFRERRARLTLENTVRRSPAVVYYQVNYELASDEPASGYLHAQWRRTNPLPYQAVAHPRSTACAGTGHYVGTYLAWGVNNTRLVGRGRDQVLPRRRRASSRRSAAPAPRTTSAAPGTSTCPARATRAFSTPYLGLPQVIRPDGLYDEPAAVRHVPLARAGPDPLRRGAAGRRSRRSAGAAGGRYLPLQDDIASTALFYLDRPTATRPPTPELDDLEPL